MEEAERFDWLVAMDAGRVLATGSPAELKARPARDARGGLHRAAARRAAARPHDAVVIPPRAPTRRRAGDRRARPDAPLRRLHGRRPRQLPHRARRDLRLPRLERLRQDHDDEDADRPAARRPRARRCCSASRSTPRDMRARMRVGYMSQSFSLYTELTVRQNLDLHARLFHLPRGASSSRASTSSSRASGSRGYRRPARRRPAARHPPAAVARRRGRARAGDADPRRADLGRRPARARRVLGPADRPVARTRA